MFSSKGILVIEKSKATEDQLMTLALDAGADDIKTEDPDVFEVTAAPADFEKVKKAIEAAENPDLFRAGHAAAENLRQADRFGGDANACPS